MATFADNAGRNALAALQRFVRKRQEQVEVCELCSSVLGPEHQHLLELEKRRVSCACDACAILFDGNARQRYRRTAKLKGLNRSAWCLSYSGLD
jgi:hypothetical protein